MKEPAPLQEPAEKPLEGSRLGKIGTPRMKNVEHVTVQENEFTCGHCDETHTPPVPMTGVEFAERLLGFVRMHRLCRKPDVPSRQLALPGTQGEPVGGYDVRNTRRVTEDEYGRLSEPMPAEPKDWYAAFEQRYPLAKGHGSLRDDLHVVLTDEQYSKLPNGTVEGWHVQSGTFHGVAHWARLMRAHKDLEAHAPGLEGMTVPKREPMPEPLATLLTGSEPAKPPKKRKGTRKA